jgi:hypothetical protein
LASRSSLRFGRRFALARLGDINAAFEIRSVFNHDAGGLDVADNRSAGPQRNAALRFHIALDGPENDDFLGLDAGVYLAVRPNSQTVAQIQRAVQIAVQVQSSSLVTSPMIFMDWPKTVGDEAGAGGAAC